MYWGSVKFFKHVIIALFLLVTLSLIVGNVFLFMRVYELTDELKDTKEIVKALEAIGRKVVPVSGNISFLSGSNFSETNLLSDAKSDALDEEPNPEQLPFELPFEEPEVEPELDDWTAIPDDEITFNPIVVTTPTPTVAPTENPTPKPSTEPSYTKLFPDMYVSPPGDFVVDKDTMFLTIDDGPSKNTYKMLDIFDEHNVEATFFIVANQNTSPEIIREMYNRGHTVAMHSSTHIYTKIYASVDAFLTDFYECFTAIYKATGVKPDTYRFPGGSINSYNKKVYMDIANEMSRRGFVFYDWNMSGADTVKGSTAESVYENSVNIARYNGKNNRNILLLHDSNSNIVIEALPNIIKFYRNKGHSFKKITNTTLPVSFIN